MSDEQMRELFRQMDNAISDIGGIQSLGTIPEIWGEIKAAQQYQPLVEALRNKLDAERRKNEFFVKMLSRISLFMKPRNIELPDGRVMEYAPPDAIVRDSWDGLTSAIKEAQEAVKQEAEHQALATIEQGGVK